MTTQANEDDLLVLVHQIRVPALFVAPSPVCGSPPFPALFWTFSSICLSPSARMRGPQAPEAPEAARRQPICESTQGRPGPRASPTPGKYTSKQAYTHIIKCSRAGCLVARNASGPCSAWRQKRGSQGALHAPLSKGSAGPCAMHYIGHRNAI